MAPQACEAAIAQGLPNWPHRVQMGETGRLLRASTSGEARIGLLSSALTSPPPSRVQLSTNALALVRFVDDEENV